MGQIIRVGSSLLPNQQTTYPPNHKPYPPTYRPACMLKESFYPYLSHPPFPLEMDRLLPFVGMYAYP